MIEIQSFAQKMQPYFNKGVRIIIWFFLIAALVIFLVHSLLAVVYPFSLDYGEAPLIDQASRLAAGKNIYRADISTPPYTIANYPPLYVISIIPFLDWFDSPFHMSRVVSVVATLLSATFIGLTIFNLSKDRLSAWTAALFFLASPYVVHWAGLARIDSLALAFATAAFFVLTRWPNSRWSWLGGGILLLSAAYTRQSYALAAPLAAFVWLWTQNKRRALALALFVGGLGIALFAVLNLLTDGGFFYNIVTANVNEFGWERLKDNLSRLWEESYIILVMGVLFLALGWRNKEAWRVQNPWPILAPFLVGAFLSGLTIGKIGSNVNYFLELAAALALIAGIMIVWSRRYPWGNTLVIFLLSIQIGIMLESSMEHNVDWNLSPRRSDFAHLQILEREVKRMDDPVLADEYMGMLTMNDRPLYLQPFEVSQLANADMWDQQPLLDEISAQAFDGILIHHFSPWPVHKERWSPEMLAAIDQTYRPAKTIAGTVIYIPRGETGISSVPAPSNSINRLAAPVWTEQPTPISAASSVAELSIAHNSQEPNYLAAITTQVSKQNCELPNCKIELIYFTSDDGGESWKKRNNFNWPQQATHNGIVTFDSEGTLFILGIRNDVIMVNQTTQADDYLASRAGFQETTRAQVSAQPWLRAHPSTGKLYLSIDAQEGDMLYVTPSLMRSDDGVQWSTTSRADQRISASDISSPRATGPDDIRVLFGEGDQVSLIWVWDPEPWGWPRTVWMANSTDGGVTFGEPTPILETWGPINTTSANGQFAVVYRTGSEVEQQLAVATTSDNGKSWTSTVASGSLSLYFEADKGPGISMTPDGTIDLVFYSQDNPSDACLQTVQSWLESLPGRIDPCHYNVYYTYSNDNGLSFAEPIKLNSQPIRGEDFIRVQGASRVISHLAVTSDTAYAYPVWIGTPAQGKTQVFGTRIER